MDKEKMKKPIQLLLILFLALGLGSYLVNKGLERRPAKIDKPVVGLSDQESDHVKVILDFGDDKLATYSGISANNAFEALLDAVQSENLEVIYKSSDFGVLVEEIAGVKNSKDSFWLYYINGQMAEVGADEYQLKKGDIVEWRYEKPKF